MSFVNIRRLDKAETGLDHDQFVVPAVSIMTQQGKKLIPNPAGNEVYVFDSLEDAEATVRRAGFDYIFEGRKTYTVGRQAGPSQVVVHPADPLRASVMILMERLRDREPTVISNAAFALGELNASEAIQPLCDILGHDDPTIRKSVAEALAKLGPKALVPLRRTWQDYRQSKQKDAPYVRLTIMATYTLMFQLGYLPVDDTLPQILEGLQDESWLVRAQAALVIGNAAQHLKND